MKETPLGIETSTDVERRVTLQKEFRLPEAERPTEHLTPVDKDSPVFKKPITEEEANWLGLPATYTKFSDEEMRAISEFFRRDAAASRVWASDPHWTDYALIRGKFENIPAFDDLSDAEKVEFLDKLKL